MKKIILVFVTLICTPFILLSQKVNDKVQIEHSGTWYNGTILKVNTTEQKYFVTYDGWSDSWNEWVGSERIKLNEETQSTSPLTKFRVGDRVEVDYGMIPEPAKIITVGENKYEIEFENKTFGKKWVTEKMIRKL